MVYGWVAKQHRILYYVVSRRAMAEGLDSSTAQGSTKRKQENVDQGGTKRTKLLKKDERRALLESVNSISIEDLAEKVMTALEMDHGSYLVQNKAQKEILKVLTGNTALFYAVLEHLRATFVLLYETHSKGKEKYLRFQLAWHNNCSIFLLPNEVPIETVVPSPTKEISNIHTKWMSFRLSSQNVDHCNKLMSMLSSSCYTVLLTIAHSIRSVHANPAQHYNQSEDGDDVYYRFGGAAICEMLHLRYKSIRNCPISKKKQIATEIDILQAINTRDKSEMPAYLLFRDKGNMYCPHSDFIPFFRDVDNVVRQVVSQDGFDEHGDELVKVLLCYYHY